MRISHGAPRAFLVYALQTSGITRGDASRARATAAEPARWRAFSCAGFCGGLEQQGSISAGSSSNNNKQQQDQNNAAADTACFCCAVACKVRSPGDINEKTKLLYLSALPVPFLTLSRPRRALAPCTPRPAAAPRGTRTRGPRAPPPRPRGTPRGPWRPAAARRKG